MACSTARYREAAAEIIAPESMPFSDLAYALREFIAAIREGRRAETHLEDNIRSLAMMSAAIQSVETSQPVAVAPLVAQALNLKEPAWT